MEAKTILLTLAVILTLSIAYYFVFALPSYNDARIAIEQRKYRDQMERQANEEKAQGQAEAERKLLLTACIEAAEESYWGYMKTNGTTRANGSVWAANYIWDRAAKDKQAALDLCFRRYAPK